jgi:DNA modification methylase
MIITILTGCCLLLLSTLLDGEMGERCILAGSPASGTVLDPSFGAGTTALVADRLGRSCVGIELNPEYVEIVSRRLTQEAGMFADVQSAA